jgi:hypothetical protein
MIKCKWQRTGKVSPPEKEPETSTATLNVTKLVTCVDNTNNDLKDVSV